MAVGCSGVIIAPKPYLCDDWDLEKANAFALLPDESPVADLVVSWNQTCAKNAALVGREWLPPVMIEAPKPWWRRMW